MDAISITSSSTYDIPKRVMMEEEGKLRGNSAVRLLEMQPWYHAMLTRLRAESLVRTPGDFLVRDSISSPGNYVVTCFWQGQAVHFQVNRLILPADESIYGSSKKILYQFEEEQFYSGTRRPLPKIPLGQRVILSEANKQLHKYPSETGLNRIQGAADRPIPTHRSTADLTLPRKPTRPPQTTQHNQRSAAMPSSPNADRSPRAAAKPTLQTDTTDLDEYCEMDYEAMDDEGKGNLTTTPVNRFTNSTALERNGNQLRQSKTSLNNLPAAKPAPPLPTRSDHGAAVRDSACVADMAIYDRPKAVSSRALGVVRRVVDVGSYHCAKLPHDNKPLSTEAQGILRSALLERPATYSALMITHEDCRLLRLLEPVDLHAGVDNGLVVLLLPHGAPVRADLLERVRCTQFTVVISILSYDDVILASKALSVWIAIAKELLMELGNIFSFVNIMAGLCCKELDHVSAIWKRLEKDQPNSMSDFQSLLVPALARLRQSGAMPPNATPCLLPYIQPMLVLMESTNTPYRNAFDWKFDDNDYQSPMDTLWQWLEMGREWSLVSAEIRAVAKRKYGNPADESVNPFRTEFFMRYLFGASGTTVESAKRFEKIRQLVALLSKRH
uniref:SH2 domain-containing protein 3A n=1 Tax=Plectus sambesii TaxID=2011161 RepID=A0A914VV26_9BILA